MCIYCNVFRNDKQWTPMSCAANHGHARLIQLLIDSDAPIDAKDRSLVCINVVTVITDAITMCGEHL